MMLKYLVIACVCAVTACTRSTAPATSAHDLLGNSTQRIAAVSAILAKHKPPPTTLLDAQFVEEQTGNGALGPSDFRAFYLVEVAPQDVVKWTQLLTPLAAPGNYEAPAQPHDWWITRDAFVSLQFYKPDILTGRANGWIGVSPQIGRIYIFTFTM